jgi:hypothetical protein
MTAYRISCTQPVLAAAQEFFADQGSYGLEGTGLLACRLAPGGWWVTDRFVAPTQDARRVHGGCWVQVTEAGKRELAAGLETGELYIARIHSHPGEAFHSETDNRNPALTFEGALSIVVPFFGLGLRRGLQGCAAYRLSGGEWRDINDEIQQWVVEETDHGGSTTPAG